MRILVILLLIITPIQAFSSEMEIMGFTKKSNAFLDYTVITDSLESYYKEAGKHNTQTGWIYKTVPDKTKVFLKDQNLYYLSGAARRWYRHLSMCKVYFYNEVQTRKKTENGYITIDKITDPKRAYYMACKDTNFIIGNGITSSKESIVKNLDSYLSNLDLEKLNAFITKYNKKRCSPKANCADSYITKAKEYISFINKKTSEEKDNSAFLIAKESGDYSALIKYYNDYYSPKHPKMEDTANIAYRIIEKQNTLEGFTSYIDDFKKLDYNKDNAKTNIYKIISKENNIIAYQWFISNYPESKESREALQNIYKLAFNDTESIGTLESYNDFVIAYPYAEQVQEAQNKAYDLEEKVYSSWFSSDEKNSRALLVKSKQLERKMSEADPKARDGYRLVIDRMNKLLQDKYPAEEATLRYLESEEFKDFYRDLKKSLASIEDTLKRIDSNTSDLSSTLKNQSRMMDSHFRKAAQSREMAAKYTEQHRFWERYLKNKGI